MSAKLQLIQLEATDKLQNLVVIKNLDLNIQGHRRAEQGHVNVNNFSRIKELMSQQDLQKPAMQLSLVTNTEKQLLVSLLL